MGFPSMPHAFVPEVLREYDIRGVVGNTLYPVDAHALGRSFGSMVARAGGKHIMVGYDGRVHSLLLEAALTEGLLSTGVTVGRIGLGPTPMLYFSVHETKADAGIMVTGSHNPPDHNGFKMLLAKHMPGGGPIYGDAIKKLAAMAAADDFVCGQGTLATIDLRDSYVTRLLQDLKSSRPLKIVWDCGNGASGEIVQCLTQKLPGFHTVLFGDIDGNFPHHHPDPTLPENLRDLQKAVRETGADLGIAFDGDADRIGAVDHLGRIMAGDQLLAVYAADILRNHKGAPIIADVKTSQTLFDQVAAHGGVPVMWKTGHSLIKAKMAEIGAPLAGEMSGHIFFADTYYGYDDALYAAMRLLSVIGVSGKSLAEWRDELPATVNTPELRFPVEETQKFAIVDAVKERLHKDGAAINDIDGVRVTTPDGWWLLRASNTQAVLVGRAEARDEMGLKRLKMQLAAHLEACGAAQRTL